jgi:hypothetical protein
MRSRIRQVVTTPALAVAVLIGSAHERDEDAGCVESRSMSPLASEGSGPDGIKGFVHPKRTYLSKVSWSTGACDRDGQAPRARSADPRFAVPEIYPDGISEFGFRFRRPRASDPMERPVSSRNETG